MTVQKLCICGIGGR